ncbi:MAG: hypothetical protein HGA45_40235 [Chloroflexales bacterium]|nr:hypothetical protein [Chloroflexales bacterium]
MSAPFPSARTHRADTLGLIVALERLAERLASQDLTHPEAAPALARLGHNRDLMRLFLACRLAHHQEAQTRLSRALELELAQADSDPAASAAFAEAL